MVQAAVNEAASLRRWLAIFSFCLAFLSAVGGVGLYILKDMERDQERYYELLIKDIDEHKTLPFHGTVGLDIVDMQRQLLEIQKSVDGNTELIEALRRNRIMFSPTPEDKRFQE